MVPVSVNLNHDVMLLLEISRARDRAGRLEECVVVLPCRVAQGLTRLPDHVARVDVREVECVRSRQRLVGAVVLLVFPYSRYASQP